MSGSSDTSAPANMTVVIGPQLNVEGVSLAKHSVIASIAGRLDTADNLGEIWCIQLAGDYGARDMELSDRSWKWL